MNKRYVIFYMELTLKRKLTKVEELCERLRYCRVLLEYIFINRYCNFIIAFLLWIVSECCGQRHNVSLMMVVRGSACLVTQNSSDGRSLSPRCTIHYTICNHISRSHSTWWCLQVLLTNSPEILNVAYNYISKLIVWHLKSWTSKSLVFLNDKWPNKLI